MQYHTTMIVQEANLQWNFLTFYQTSFGKLVKKFGVKSKLGFLQDRAIGKVLFCLVNS